MDGLGRLHRSSKGRLGNDFYGIPYVPGDRENKSHKMPVVKMGRSTARSEPGEIVETEDKLNTLFGQPVTETTIAQRHDLYHRLHSLLAQEEVYWLQRSREN